MSKLRQTRALPSLLMAAGLAIGLLDAPRSAGADPISYLPAPGTAITVKFTNYESLVDTNLSGGPNAGDTLKGVFTATTIAVGTTTLWSRGLDGSELNGYFDFLVASSVTFPPPGLSTFTGGSAVIYNVPFGTFAPAGGPGAATFYEGMICGGSCAALTPWLTFAWVPYDGAGHTQDVYTTASGAGSAFTAYLTVTGGTAAAYFDNNAYGPVFGGGYADGTISSTFIPCPASDSNCAGWALRSQDPIDTQVVPEPTTILLWGTVLLGVGVARRRFSARLAG